MWHRVTCDELTRACWSLWMAPPAPADHPHCGLGDTGKSQQPSDIAAKPGLHAADVRLRRDMAVGTTFTLRGNVLPVVLPIERRAVASEPVPRPGALEAPAAEQRQIGPIRLDSRLQRRKPALERVDDLGSPGRPIHRFRVQTAQRLEHRTSKRRTRCSAPGAPFAPDRQTMVCQRRKECHRGSDQCHRDGDIHVRLDHRRHARFGLRPCNSGLERLRCG